MKYCLLGGAGVLIHTAKLLLEKDTELVISIGRNQVKCCILLVLALMIAGIFINHAI